MSCPMCPFDLEESNEMLVGCRVTLRLASHLFSSETESMLKVELGCRQTSVLCVMATASVAVLL